MRLHAPNKSTTKNQLLRPVTCTISSSIARNQDISNMNKSTIVLLLAASMSAASLLLAAGDDACPGVQMESMDAACRNAAPAMYDLCMRVLSSSPPTSEISTYALTAANAAADSCRSTLHTGEESMQNGTFKGGVFHAWDYCVNYYDAAIAAIAGVQNQLRSCNFAGMAQGYIDAMFALEQCAAKLLDVDGTSTPTYGTVVGDRDLDMVAFGLAKPLIP
ncbi:hypothetical protein ACP70R_003506 [Stipagrostis hirtigluma subsp. patula]